MTDALCRRLHRWLSLIFALPIALLLASGRALALEALLDAATPAGLVTEDRLRAAIARVGPLVSHGDMIIRGHAGTVSFADAATIDLVTGEPVAPDVLTRLFALAREVHRGLLLDLGWLVTGSGAALVVLLLAGPGLRARGQAGRAHGAIGLALLPALLLPPLSGLAVGQWLGRPQEGLPDARGLPARHETMLAAIAATHDLRRVERIAETWGGSIVTLRDADGSRARYRHSARGVERYPSWTLRLVHEGRWAGAWGAGAMLAIALASLGLLAGGIALWGVRLPARLRAAARTRREAAAERLSQARW